MQQNDERSAPGNQQSNHQMAHLVGVLMRQQHQCGQNGRPGDQRDRQRYDKRLFTRRQAAAAAFRARENHLDGNQEQNNSSGNGNRFGTQIQESENFFASKQEDKHHQQGDEQLADHDCPAALGFGVLQHRHEDRQVSQWIHYQDQ